MMFAVAHDYRVMRRDRGYMCAIEVEIGVGIPPPELALFAHAMPRPAFYDTVMGAKRWGAEEALAAGLVSLACSHDTLFDEALAFAEKQARLARGARGRTLFMSIKNQAKGHVNRMVMDYCFPRRALPEAIGAVDGGEAEVGGWVEE